MRLTLQAAADYIRTARAPRGLLALIRRCTKVISFTEEHANRAPRYVKIVRAYKLGRPVRDLEAEFGCAKGTILRYARMADLPKRPKHFDAGIRNAVIAMYQSGRPIAEIQARLGVSQAYISKTATEEGINRRASKKRTRAVT